MKGIKRYFSENAFVKFKDDFSFLIKKIKDSKGELDLQIRPYNRFNIYYKGNSLAEVTIQGSNYSIKIHEKFESVEAAKEDKPKQRFPKERFSRSGKYYDKIILNSNELHIFFQNSIIERLKKNIKNVNYKEEITFEQSLITDNIDSKNVIIIDRQVAGGGLKGTLDLLALKEIDHAKYRLVVLEVKLGNNDELKDKVIGQIKNYIEVIQERIEEFRNCYEENYAQKKAAGLFPDEFPENITIDNEVEGRIVVGLYSEIGKKYIKELLNKYPDWENKIIQFYNKFDGDNKL